MSTLALVLPDVWTLTSSIATDSGTLKNKPVREAAKAINKVKGLDRIKFMILSWRLLQVPARRRPPLLHCAIPRANDRARNHARAILVLRAVVRALPITDGRSPCILWPVMPPAGNSIF